MKKKFMNSMVKRIGGSVLVGALTVSMLTACGSGGDSDSDSSTSSSADVQTIVVGTAADYQPYTYQDEDGNITGYDIEVLKKIDEMLPQYEFEYEIYDFKNVLLAIDSGKVDIGANQFEKNEEREKKYAFSDTAYTTFVMYIAVNADTEGVETLDDLAGKSVFTYTGGNDAYVLEEYNEEHPDNPIDIQYYDTLSDEEKVAGVESGKFYAFLSTKRDIEALNEEFGDTLKIVGEPVSTSSTYFVFSKDNTQLQEDVSAALEELKESGELAQLSIDIVGGDYTEDE